MTSFAHFRDDRPAPVAAYLADRPCPLCGGLAHRPLLEFEQFQFYVDAETSTRATIRQVQCRACFAAFMNPVFTPEGFAVLFAKAGASYGSSSIRQDEQIGWLQGRGLLAPGRTLLDVGCYEGSFLGKLPVGLRGIGVDIDAPAIERAALRHGGAGHRFVRADFETVELDERVDVITMFHVLEHLPHPVAVLRQLARLAHRGTRLLVEVPVVENVIPGDVCGFLTVQHLTHFSVGSLGNALAVAGWRVIAFEAMSGYNGYRVITEPAGAELAKLAPVPDDCGHFHEYLAGWHRSLADIETRIRRLDRPRRVLRGGGLHAEYLYHLTSLAAGSGEFLVVDGDPLKQGQSWRGIPIVGPERLPELDWSRSQILLSSYSHQEAMREEARRLGIPDPAVVTLYDEIFRY